MNSDTLELLLIDRDAGELPPDVLELLAAYLEAEPAASREAAQLEDTLRLAKAALAPRHRPALPSRSFKRELRVLERESETSARLPQWALGMAACFVCGVLAGWFWLRPATPQVVERRVVVGQAVTPPAALPSDFWSASRLYRAELASAHSSSSGLVWESPVKRPQLKSPL